MKIRTIIILIVATTLGTGIAYRLLHISPPLQVPESPPPVMPSADESKKETSKPKPEIRTNTPVAESIPLSVRKVEILPAQAAAPTIERQPAPTKVKPDPAAQWWEQQAKRFNQLLEQLSREQNPTRRQQLIRTLAAYVRIDTPGAIEWAMGLEDPEERRLAMEAINKYALTGIGARIAVDETGFPSIRETTVMSAVESTGMVEPGDYIIGVRDETGRYVDFEGLSIHQIIQYLRGKAGSDILLYMERPQDGGAYAFEVPVKRSLLVVQPPY